MSGLPPGTDAGAAGGGAAPGPEAAGSLLEIARHALLDHLERGDPRHALRLLLIALGRWLGDPVAVRRIGSDGREHWAEGDARALAGVAQIALTHLDQPVGMLCLAEPVVGLAARLEPVLPTIALLALRSRESAEPTRTASPEAIRAALASAGTFVWQWDIETDWLADIDAGLSMLGHKQVSCEGLTQADWNRLIHPDDLAGNEEAYERHARGETAFYEHTYRVKSVDGSWRWMQERGCIVERGPDGSPRRMMGTQTDVTERVLLQQQASAAMHRLRQVAEHVPGVLYQCEMGPDGVMRFTYVSERVQELFGVSVAQVLADSGHLQAVIHPDDLPGFGASVMASRETMRTWRREFRVCPPGSAKPRWLLGVSTPQAEPGGRTVWSGHLQDITERRELEAAREAASVADAANRAKTGFLSRMSHELRTPLNAVLGFAQLMEIDTAEPPGPAQAKRLKLIREAGEHLLHMIGDMLDLTRVEAGAMALVREPVALRALAEQSLELVRGQAEKTGVVLVLEPGDEVMVAADRTRARQVLLNLLANAIKYNQPGGRVELTVRAAGSRGLVLVADTGVGIPEADLPRVFEPFHRGRQAQGGVEGTGIGLAVTRALVELMGGSVMVASTPGQGSVFTVGLPLADPPVR